MRRTSDEVMISVIGQIVGTYEGALNSAREHIDPDIACLKSWSEATKFRKQVERNFIHNLRLDRRWGQDEAHVANTLFGKMTTDMVKKMFSR